MSGARLTTRLTHFATERLRARHPDWADALAAEHDALAGGRDDLAWALGALRASLVLAPPSVGYPLLLPLAVLAMALYQWSADEGVVTLVVLGALGFCLGFLQPRRALMSAVALGVVVTVVNGFESLSGLRPAYETHIHSLTHCLRWLMLILPALAAVLAGRGAFLWLQILSEEAS